MSATARRALARRVAAALALAPWLAIAVGAAVLVSAPARAGEADDGASIGRLFMTPAERRALDQRRERGAVDETAPPRDLLPARTRVDRRVVMNGMVRPRHAEPVVWINGQPARVARGPDSQGRVTLGAGGPGAGVRLKPGQSWDPLTRRVRDCAQCAAAAPAAPEPFPSPAGPQAAMPPDSATPVVASVSSAPAPAAAAGPAAP